MRVTFLSLQQGALNLGQFSGSLQAWMGKPEPFISTNVNLKSASPPLLRQATPHGGMRVPETHGQKAHASPPGDRDAQTSKYRLGPASLLSDSGSTCTRTSFSISINISGLDNILINSFNRMFWFAHFKNIALGWGSQLPGSKGVCAQIQVRARTGGKLPPGTEHGAARLALSHLFHLKGLNPTLPSKANRMEPAPSHPEETGISEARFFSSACCPGDGRARCPGEGARHRFLHVFGPPPGKAGKNNTS